jgi:hypothetical protein
MAVDFRKPACVSSSTKKKFGICDDQPPLPKGPAYIDETNGAKWIAVVVNDPPIQVLFTAIDNCIDILRPDRKMDKRCDGMLSYNETVIFVELKETDMKGAEWIKKADLQLRTTIKYFEEERISDSFNIKKAYIANSERPKFRDSQQVRMEKFEEETGYVLRIENRIIL